MRRLRLMTYAVFFWGVAGCNGLTREEAKVTVEEMSLASQASTLTGGTIEISTQFTLGQAVEEAAEELAAFYASQLPCANVVVTGAQLAVTYGANGGVCLYNGQTWTGRHTIQLVSVGAEEVIVKHTWDALSNGTMSVTGTADVTWSEGFMQRHVVHQLQWTRVTDGREGVGSGDRMQEPLNGAWENGIVINGERDWEGESGRWNLEIEGVEAQWVDPVPQAGIYTLDTPFDKSATLSFQRIDEETIEVSLESGKNSFTFRVTRSGTVTSV